MKTIVKNFTTYVIILSLLAIVLGIVLVAYPGMSLVAIGYVVASYLILHGIVLIILDIKAWRLYIPFEGLLQGILSIILGVLLAKNPESIEAYIGIALGVWIIVSSFSGIKLACALRRTGAPWVFMIVMNVISIVIGCLVLYSPVLSALSLTVWLGSVLIAYSVINLIYMLVVKKYAKDVEKLIKEKMNPTENIDSTGSGDAAEVE